MFMTTLFIHLSDLHLSEDSFSNNAFSGVIRCVLDDTKRCDNVFLVFSGDMTQDGSESHAESFGRMISGFQSDFLEKTGKKPEILLVPGNHDIVLPDPKTHSYPITSHDSPSELDEKFDNSLSCMSTSLGLCKDFGSFRDGPCVSVRTFELGDTCYRFLLLNSAPLSWREKVDKGNHRIPARYLPLSPGEMQYGKKTVEIVVSHHRHDWFEESKSQPALRDYIDRYSSIVFTGHDHRPFAFQSVSKRSVVCSEGGELTLVSGKIKGSFQTLLLSEDSGTIEGKRYVCEPDCDAYLLDDDHHFKEEISYREPFPLARGVRGDFFRSPLRSGEGTLLDFFVAPDLYADGKEEEVSGLDEILNRIRDEKEMFLLGSAKSGKTSLLKVLFLKARSFGVPVYVDLSKEGLSSVTPRIAEKVAFERLYGDSERLRKEFDALPLGERIVLVDNFSFLEEESKKKDWLEYFKERYGITVFSLVSSYNPRERIVEDTFIDPDHRYHIMGLTAKKREELAKKIGASKGVDPQNYIDLYNTAEAALRSSSLLDYTDPEDLILALEEIADKKLYLERNTSNAFTEIFTYSIDQSLVSASSVERLEDLKIVTSRLAYLVVQRDSTMDVSGDDIVSATETCVNQFDNIKLDGGKTKTYLCKAGILYHRGDGTFRFRRNSFLSYFAALEYRRLMEDGDLGPVNQLLEKACKGLNGDILLFLCFITKNKTLFARIESELQKEFEGWPPLSIADKNNWLLEGDRSILPTPKEKTHEESVESVDKAEHEKLPSASDEEERAFANDPSEHLYVLEKGFKLTEILFKAISGFKGSFDKTQRERLLKTAINAERSMLQYVFDINQNDLEESEDSFSKYKKQQLERHKEWSAERRQLFKSLTLADYFRTLLFDMVFLSEFTFASVAASSVSLPLITTLDGSEFQNRIFKLGAYLHLANEERFLTELESTAKAFSKEWQKNIVKRIAYFYIAANGPSYRIQTKIHDTVAIGTSDTKRQGMIKARNSFFRKGKRPGKKKNRH